MFPFTDLGPAGIKMQIQADKAQEAANIFLANRSCREVILHFLQESKNAALDMVTA
jgi:hypothetical protein